jgi:hypothetical protein
MKASKCTFGQMMTIAAGNRELAKATSFIQVEYGKKELLACWDGFVEACDHFQEEFKSRKDICNNFTVALTEFTHDQQSTFDKVGY